MCDDRTEKDIEEYLSSHSDISRRQLGKTAVGMTLSMMLPSVANAQTLTEAHVEIPTPDGIADSYFVHPVTGQHPGVLLWTDIVGLRPVFQMMAKRLAQSGYSVLVPNPYYRTAKAPVINDGASFMDPAVREFVITLRNTLSAQTDFTDTEAFISFLDKQTSVDSHRKIGTAGYCMGGSMVMRTAGSNPRVGAGASFHGVDLVTDAEDSPHLLIPKMHTSMLICIAANDDEKEPEVKNILKQSFAEADVQAEIEVYDALHGWCRPEGPAYHEAQAERAWARLLHLFKNALV
jgi:carboxymethylenebutenolidase